MGSLHLPPITDLSWLVLLPVVGYPLLVLALLEVARAIGPRHQFSASVLHHIAYVLLPMSAIWLTLRWLAELPAENWAVRSAETAVALTSLYLLLRLAQAALEFLISDEARAPKLMLDVLRIGLSLVWGAVVVSKIWEVDLQSLLTAMGVGSIVLGFALQEFLGNLLSGLGLLSAHKFSIGDWIEVGGTPAQVVEMDWRTVTLVTSAGKRMVVANSSLARDNLVILARANEPSRVQIPLMFPITVPPEFVRDVVLETGRLLPASIVRGEVKCFVTSIAGDMVNYSAQLAVADPGEEDAPRNEFLSHFWYVAQRRGLRLGNAATDDDQEGRLRMLAAAGTFHREPDVLAILARASAFRRYRRADVLQVPGVTSTEALFVVSGSLAVSVPRADGGAVQLELVGPGQLLVLHETLSGNAGPIKVVAEQDTDLLAIPAAALNEAMERNAVIARDVTALAEARRLAIQPLTRGLRAVTQ